MKTTSDEGMLLTPDEGRKLWIRAIVVAGLCAIAFGWGQYAIAPGGEYTFLGIEKTSFDPATYRWFFQGGLGLWAMIYMGSWIGALLALLAIPAAAVLTAVLRFTPQARRLARAWIDLNWLWLAASVIVAWIAGLCLTIHYGVNPGICC